MEGDTRQFSTADLANIFDQAARSSNREWRSTQREMAGLDEFELPPARAMMDRSPVVGYARQVLPETVGDTSAGGWVANQVQKLAEAQPQMRPTLNRVNALAQKMPLGGFSQSEMETYSQERLKDDNLRRNTVEVGMVPTRDNTGEVRTKGDIGANLAQAGGVLAGDVASDGLRNIWWFINAPQAVANLMADEVVQRGGHEILGRKNEPIIKNRGVRMAATLPAVLATSFGVGNVMREEGYKAVLPSEEDPKQSSNAVAEAGARYFLGRTGGLLPYDEFVKERPDVSRQEYQDYKRYLHDKTLDINPLDGDFNVGGVIKGTVDGIHGPEVAFLGKSIPALTGIAPVAAALYGARRGMKRAKDKLRNSPDGNLIDKADVARNQYKDAKKTYRREQEEIKNFDPVLDGGVPTQTVSKEDLDRYSKAYNDTQQAVERVTLENALLGGGAGAIAGGVGSTALESVIRSLKPTVVQEPED